MEVTPGDIALAEATLSRVDELLSEMQAGVDRLGPPTSAPQPTPPRES